jgi:hypothetical protein
MSATGRRSAMVKDPYGHRWIDRRYDLHVGRPDAFVEQR